MNDHMCLADQPHHIVPGTFERRTSAMHAKFDPAPLEKALDVGDLSRDAGSCGADWDEAEIRYAFFRCG